MYDLSVLVPVTVPVIIVYVPASATQPRKEPFPRFFPESKDPHWFIEESLNPRLIGDVTAAAYNVSDT